MLYFRNHLFVVEVLFSSMDCTTGCCIAIRCFHAHCGLPIAAWLDSTQHSARLSAVFITFASAGWCIIYMMMLQRLLPQMIMLLCHILYYLHSVFIVATKNNETKGNFVPHLIMPSDLRCSLQLVHQRCQCGPIKLTTDSEEQG